MRCVSMLCLCLCAMAQRLPERPLYGVSYYHEYMPEERLDRDIELMKRANLTVVRLGESTWSSWEPRDGQFEFAWMDRVLDKLHAAGIQAIVGTPTYSIPPWLAKKHPDILVLRYTSAPPLGDPYMPSYHGTATPGAYGPRQNMDLTHPEYRRHAERVIRAGDRLPGGQRNGAERPGAAERAKDLRGTAKGKVRHPAETE
jgi:beta-galactosidase